MPGIVYSAGPDATLGRFGEPITVAGGAVIPPGEYLSSGGLTLTNPDESTTTIPGGLIVSDGYSLTAASAGTLIPLGARGANNPPVWPWPAPWPLNLTP